MESKTEYVILPEHKLIIECFSGEIGLEDILRLKDSLLSDPLYESSYSILEDFRNCSLNWIRDEIEELAKWLAWHAPGKRRSAILTNQPEQVVAAELFAQYSQKASMKIKVFSTVEAAMGWTRISNISKQDVEEIIQRSLS